MAIAVVTTLNPLEENITFQKTPVSNKFYSSKLLNYVESVEIAGFRKTVFYTELNTNLNVGDRVFIVNGNYDSNNFISIDKYTKYTDGYRVLGCDGCRLILDLDYTGEIPYVEDNQDNSIKIYHVRTQREFDYINSIFVNHQGISFIDDLNAIRTYFGSSGRMSKFCGRREALGSDPADFTVVICADSIIYVDKPWLGSTILHNKNDGVNGKGFFVRDDVSTSSNPVWINITSQILNNKIKIVNSNNYSNVQPNLYINGEDFTSNNIEFKQRNTYRYLDSTWKLDVRYKTPYVSRLNFRFGRFNGDHKDGIFGTNLRRNNWRSAVWTSGTFLNSIWNSGAMNSKSTSGEQSYYATYENKTIPPVQTIDFSNNKGYGYNLIEDSIIVAGAIQNGNFENCNLGRGTTFSSLDVYFGQTYSYDLKLSGLYNRCDLNGISSERAKFKNSNLINSSLVRTSLVNSQIYQSTANSSTFTDEEGINVLAADMWGYTLDGTSESSIRGIIKLYISDSDARKVNISDSFYLTKINKNLFLTNLSNDEKIKLPIETKFLFDIYSDFELDNNKIVVTLKNKNDNKTKSIVRRGGTLTSLTGFSNVFTVNPIEYSSIDIECNSFGWYEGMSVSTSVSIGGVSSFQTSGGPATSQTTNQIVLVTDYRLSPITPRNVNLFFTGTYVRNADFRNGYFDSSTWLSGANINYNHHVIPFDGNNNLNILTAATDTLYIGLEQNRLNQNISIFGEDLVVGDTVWLNSIDHIVGSAVKSIDGRYRVQSIVNGTFREVYLKSLSGVTFVGTAVYRTSQSQGANYSSIHKFQINNSTINSGLLCRTSIKNSTIFNSEFNNFDKNLDILNIERLRLINILFKDTKNNIKSGYVHKSHIINDTWTSGVVYNSIWNGAVFQDGVFNNGYWQSGVFKNGSFINSKDITTSTQSYDNSTNLYRNWLNGTFENGEFFNSIWFKGTFKNGRFYNSEWYSGLWENGILGSKSIRTNDTKFGYSSPILPVTGTNSTWNDGIVENALIGGSGSVYWVNGKFNDGEFTSFGQIGTNESIWYDGQFNNGKFSGLARWKNGKFFKGKFHSHYGYTLVSPTNPSTYSTSYGWENGKFLGGEFGTGDLGTNSVWYNGEFSGGNFQGRFWYNGLFSNGNFLGSGTASLLYSSNISNSGEYEFANSFRSRYYGLWYNGNVSDNPKSIKTEERVSTELIRKVEEERVSTIANMRNILWANGTFSHKGGTIQDSLWLKGNFYDGIFDSSIFNPYVDRTFSGSLVSTFAATTSCVWHNGIFESTLGTGSFYVSDWERGTFNKGYMSGGIWKNGVWNYGFADNIVWLNGLWRNGNWNSAPFGISDLVLTQPYQVISGRATDILLNVMRTLGNQTLYLNNVFSASVPVPILTDIDINNGVNQNNGSVTFDQTEQYPLDIFGRDPNTGAPSNSISFRDCSLWITGTTFSSPTGQVLTNSHVYTNGGQSIPSTGASAESAKLYACRPNLNRDVFYQANRSYVINLQVTVEGVEKVDIFIKVGNKDEIKIPLQSLPVVIGGSIIYRPKQYNFRFIYSTPTISSPTDTQFYIKKGRGGIMRLLFISISQVDYEYHPVHNNSIIENTLLSNTILVPTAPEISYDAVSTDGNVVSVSFGNGLFKSGIWENGIWNNGYRSNDFVGEKDYYLFSDIVGLNGVFPYGGKGTYQISSVSWLVTLQSIETLEGLNVGDRISIGNLVAIDINEARKLIKDYYTIQQIDLTSNTIVVELITNFPILRVEKDSSNHIIYVTKNVWLTGAFLNGYFKGVWNNGLFKSYPRIGVMDNSEWIDGKFDGGRFISNIETIDLLPSYNTGLIQNFTFFDNNQEPGNRNPKFTSWIDVNFSNSQKTTINQESVLYYEQTLYNSGFTYSYFQDNRVEISLQPLTIFPVLLSGFVTSDVLESVSSFRDIRGVITRYRLGSKYKVYQNLIPNNGNFFESFSNNRFGLDLTNFRNDGWNWVDWGTDGIAFSGTASPTYSRTTFKASPIVIESNVDVETQNRLRIKTANIADSAIFYESKNQSISVNKIAKFVLQNTNIDRIRNRYYVTELDLYTYSISTNPWDTNFPIAGGFGTSSDSFFGTSQRTVQDLNVVNDFRTSPLIKRQFFYNKTGLDLWMESRTSLNRNGNFYPNAMTFSTFLDYVVPPTNSFNFVFNNISFLEVDMIPFFNYFRTPNSIDMRIKTPWYAVAPLIDYSDANFDFIGNVNITIDTETIANQVNFTVVSAQSSGSIFPPVTPVPETFNTGIL